MKEPTPPDVAQYVIDGLRAQSAPDLEELASFCEELAAYKRRPVSPVSDQHGIETNPEDRESASGDEIEIVDTADPEDVLEESDIEEMELDTVEAATGGTVVIKKVPCGKGCDGCPHGPYAYLNWRDGSGTVRMKYLRPISGSIDG